MKRIFSLVLAAAMGISAAFLTACSQQKENGSGYFVEFSMSEGFQVDGQVLSASRRAALQEKIGGLLQEIEDEVSVEKEGGDVARINAAGQNEQVFVGQHTQELLRQSQTLYDLTGGAFSPALYTVSDLWGFTPRFAGRYSQSREEPSAEAIEQALALSDFSDISLSENGEVSKKTGGVQLDFGGIAKGYMSDRILSLLQAEYPEGHLDGTISVMSNSLLFGMVEDGDTVRGYNMRIDNPRKLTTGVSEALFAVGLSDVAVSTSADTYRFYVYGDTIYKHILDASTGRPSDNGVISITTIVPLSVPYAGTWADALSTAGFCMPLRGALVFYDTLFEEYGIGAVVLTSDFRYYVTGNFTVLNRKDYAALTKPELEESTENIFTFTPLEEAPETVIACEQEQEYIRAVAELTEQL